MFRALILVILTGVAFVSHAQDRFSTGPLIKDFGPTINNVVQTNPLRGDEHFKVAFDVADAGATESSNRGFISAARFLNMHVKAGVPAENIKLAIVVHGKAGQDLLKDAIYNEQHLVNNPNTALLKALMEKGVQVAICAQSAGFFGIKNEDLLPGVEVALSAMTKHALLQQQGYTLNPF